MKGKKYRREKKKRVFKVNFYFDALSFPR